MLHFGILFPIIAVMANSFTYKDKKFAIGDTVNLIYKVKEADKEREQSFEGILINIRGKDVANKMITIRKITRSGIGVERIIPLNSPSIVDIKLVKKSPFTKSKLYFIRNLSDQQLKHKLYRSK